MSLPTPPKSSHRDKENSRPVASGSRGVEWSKTLNQYHPLSSPLQATVLASSSNVQPKKSILKKSAQIPLPFPDIKPRDVTPQPTQPKDDANYLQYPISQILSPETSLTDRVEAYSVLAARLRASIGDDEPQSNWPLFEPIRQNRDAIHQSFLSSLENALVEPVVVQNSSPRAKKTMLPSPKKSPRKKRDGMSSEEIKHARDLSTSCLAVIRLLNVILPQPAMYKLFTDAQLGELVTAVLAIPLAIDLPCLNSRKTCALSIWLIQTQRLPEEVLLPARDRIAYAIRRGIEGELGKEGKKGSVSDGLRAIHDLSMYQPSTFVPAFTEILNSILSNLLANSLNIRLLACHALGGFAYASILLPNAETRARIASVVSTFLKTAPLSASPGKKSSPGTIVESAIARTLRTTLNVEEPTVVAQGPVWALNVLASFTIMLGSTLYKDMKVSRILTSLLGLGMRHKRSAVRALGALTWRCTTWTYFQPPLPFLDKNEEDEPSQSAEERKTNKELWWKIAQSVVDMAVGTSLIGGLIGKDQADDDAVHRCTLVLKRMLGSNRLAYGEAMSVIQRLVSFQSTDTQWRSEEALPIGLFSANPGLLTAEFATLSNATRDVLQECPNYENIRSFTIDELASKDLLKQLTATWVDGLGFLQGYYDKFTTKLVTAAWKGLIQAEIQVARCTESDVSTVAFNAGKIIMDILQDHVWSGKATQPASPSILDEPKLPNAAAEQREVPVKLSVVRQMWAILLEILPHGLLSVPAERLVGCLMKYEDELAGSGDQAQTEWTKLCIEVLLICESEEPLKAFWGMEVEADIVPWKWDWTPAIRGHVWQLFIDRWMQARDSPWENIVVLLAAPFVNGQAWELTSDQFDKWDDLLIHAIDKVYDCGADHVVLLDVIAETLSTNYDPTTTSTIQAVDYLLRQLAHAVAESDRLPMTMLEYLNETMRSTYPAEPRSRNPSLWMLRSLVQVIEHCPRKCISDLLKSIQEGLALWIADEYSAFPEDHYDDVLTVYEMVLLRMKELPNDVETMKSFSPLLEAVFCNQSQKPDSAVETFAEFWRSMFCGVVSTDLWPSMVPKLFEITLPVVPTRAVQETVGCIDSVGESSNYRFPLSPSSPSTPLKVLHSAAVTPPRPIKSRASLPLTSPESPSKVAVPSFTPPASPSAPKKRKLDNKENESPQLHLTTAESNAKRGPGIKRRSSEVGLDEQPGPKKLKVEEGTLPTVSTGGLASDRTREGKSSQSATEPKLEVTTPSRKRKRLILDAVEVPMLRDVYSRPMRRSLSLEKDGIELVVEQKALDLERDGIEITSNTLPWKGKRTSRAPKRYQEISHRGSDSQESSSDDDPHLGQVTPHHLLSPMLQRSSKVDEDDIPASDDTVDSPTKGVLRRRLERTVTVGERRRR